MRNYYVLENRRDRCFSESLKAALHTIRTWNPELIALPFASNSYCCVVHKGVVVSTHAINASRDIRSARKMITDRRPPDPRYVADLDVPLKQLI